MKIPLGNFGFQGPAPVDHTFIRDRGGEATAQALQGLAATGMKIGEGMAADARAEAAQKAADEKELANANAGVELLRHENKIKEFGQSIEQRLADGSLHYSQAAEAFRAEIQLIEPPKIDNMNPAMQVKFAGHVENVNEDGYRSILKASDVAMKGYFKTQADAGIDELGKQAGYPNADIDKINARIDGLDKLGQRAYGANWGKVKQDFRDKNWTNDATQRAMNNRESLDGLKQLEKDLTNADGYYAGKLDTDKRNTVLSAVINNRIRLENRQNALADKAEAVATKTVDALENDVMTGIPVTPNRVTVDLDSVKGTSQEKRFQEVLGLGIDVQKTLALPPSEQAEKIQRMRTELMSKGADYPAREKRLLDMLTNATDAFKKTLLDEPLQAISQRTGREFVPLDVNALTDPTQIRSAMADRESFVNAARKEYGPEVKPRLFKAGEAELIKKAMEPMSANDQRTLLTSLKTTMSGEAFRASMDQIGADNTMKLAGIAESYGYKTTEGRSVAQLMLEGRKLLKDSTVLMPKDKPDVQADSFQSTFNSVVGEAIPYGTQARQTALEATKAIYAVLAKEGGKLNGTVEQDIVRRAVGMATGGVVDYSGSKVIPPYAMSESDFRDKAWQQIDELKGKSSLEPSALRQLPLESYGDGYAFKNGRNYVPGPDGKPLTIKVAR